MAHGTQFNLELFPELSQTKLQHRRTGVTWHSVGRSDFAATPKRRQFDLFTNQQKMKLLMGLSEANGFLSS